MFADALGAIMQVEPYHLSPVTRNKYLSEIERLTAIEEKGTEELLDLSIAFFRVNDIIIEDVFTTIMPLSIQIELIQKLSESLDAHIELLLNTTDTSLNKQMVLGYLFSAKSRNQLALASVLSTAILWKSYFVYPPQLIANIIQTAKENIEKSIHFHNHIIPTLKIPISTSVISPSMSQNLMEKDIVTFLKLTTNSQPHQDFLAVSSKKEVKNGLLLYFANNIDLLRFLRSERLQNALLLCRSAITIEEMLSKEMKPFYNTIDVMNPLITFQENGQSK